MNCKIENTFSINALVTEMCSTSFDVIHGFSEIIIKWKCFYLRKQTYGDIVYEYHALHYTHKEKKLLI